MHLQEEVLRGKANVSIPNKMSNISLLILIIISMHCFIDKSLVEFAETVNIKKKNSVTFTVKNQQL